MYKAADVTNSFLTTDARMDKTNHHIAYLRPPGLSFSTEVSLCPGGEDDGAGFVSGTVGKSKWKRSGSTNNSSGGSVLRGEKRVKTKQDMVRRAVQIKMKNHNYHKSKYSLEIRGMGT